MIEFGILGPLLVRKDGAEVEISGARRRALLVRLLTSPNHPVDAEILVDDLWEDSPPRAAAATLQSHVSFLRRILGADRLRHTAGGYVLVVGGGELDLHLFESETIEGQRSLSTGELGTAAELLSAALARWRGPALSDVRTASWARPEVTRLEELRLGCFEAWHDALLAQGRHQEVAASAEAAVVEHPLRERIWAQLMLALYRCGRQADALRAFQRLRTGLGDELGIDPSPDLVALDAAILQQKPELEWDGSSVLPSSRPTTGPAAAGGGSRARGPATADLPSGTVTFLFTDIEGSTLIWESLGKEMEPVLDRHGAILREAIESNKGYVFKEVGDAFCAAFSSPVEAVGAAAGAQRVLAEETWPDGATVRVRMGLHTGECQVRDGDYVGLVVNRAARLMSAASGGQTVLSDETANLLRDSLPGELSLRDLGDHRFAGLSRASHVYQLCTAGLPDEFPPIRSLSSLTAEHNLPTQASSFVGRVAELAEVRSMLGEAQLVTLTGPGGTGKTRMAVAVASELLGAYRDGIWLVELASLPEAELVESSVASVLKINEEPGQSLDVSLLDGLRARQLLLVLDNCEHVIDSCAKLVHQVLRSCPDVRVIATSRSPLGIDGEHIYKVPTLAAPPVDVEDSTEIAASPAVRLFLDRATAQRPDFELDQENATVIASVCRRLDGIPLAIELAAARMRSLSVADVDRLLDDRFRLLTGGNRAALSRQRTLRALVDWSHDLLNPSEKAVLRRLSVLAGGFDLEAACAVAAGDDLAEWEVMDLLTSLVDNSLVQTSVTRETMRFSMLETVRLYAAEQLAGSGSEEPTARQAHAMHFMALAVEAADHQSDARQGEWLKRLEVEHDNLRAAAAYLIETGQADALLATSASLCWYWATRAHYQEGIDLLRSALTLSAEQATIKRVRALEALGRLHGRRGEVNAAVPVADEALSLARQLGDRNLVADQLRLAAEAKREHEPDEALRLIDEAVDLARDIGEVGLLARVLTKRSEMHLESRLPGAQEDSAEALGLLRQVGDTIQIANLLNNLGYWALGDGDLETARAHFEEALGLAQDLGCSWLEVILRANLGIAFLLEQKYEEAQGSFVETLNAAIETDDRGVIPYALFGLALCIVGTGGEDLRATKLQAASEELLKRLGQHFDPLEATLRDEALVRLRTSLGEEGYAAAYQEGEALSLTEAVELLTG